MKLNDRVVRLINNSYSDFDHCLFCGREGSVLYDLVTPGAVYIIHHVCADCSRNMAIVYNLPLFEANPVKVIYEEIK